jgi:hypothetical protein
MGCFCSGGSSLGGNREWPGGWFGIVGGRCGRAGGLSLWLIFLRRLFLFLNLGLLLDVVRSFHAGLGFVILLQSEVVAPTVRLKRCCLCL